MDLYPLLLLKRALAAAVLPPVGPLLLVLFAVFIARRMPRLGRTLFWVGLLSSLAFATPFVARHLAETLETTDVLEIMEAKRAQAIVVLSGDMSFDAPEYRGDVVGSHTLQRVRYGARVAKLTGLPVLVSGGSPEGGGSLALAMREVFERDFGVPVRWTESASLDTRENAQYSHDILAREKIHRIVLVTHAMHMPRAQAHFVEAGFEVIPAPTGFTRAGPSHWHEFVPGASAQQTSAAALREWIGRAAAMAGIGKSR